MNGAEDADIVAGDSGSDDLFGSSGNDDLYPGQGGAQGDDEVTGGPGSDTAWLCPAAPPVSISGDIASEGGIHVVPTGQRAEFC